MVIWGGFGCFGVVWDDSMDRLLIVDGHQIQKKICYKYML